MTPKQEYYETLSNTIIKNLEKRNMEGYYFPSKEECKQAILDLLPDNSSVAWGGSESLKEIDLFPSLQQGNYNLIDRLVAKNSDESRELYSQSVMADYYLMSTNAITTDGELVNIDGNGNRVACLIHGPKHVFIIAGMNKIAVSVDAAVERVHNQAAPPNSKRLNRQTPCNYTGICNDCLSPDCMCNHTVITRRSGHVGRIKVFLVGEELGY